LKNKVGKGQGPSAQNLLYSFGQIWLDLGEITAKVIFGQNQNLASPNTFDLLRLWWLLMRLNVCVCYLAHFLSLANYFSPKNNFFGHLLMH